MNKKRLLSLLLVVSILLSLAACGSKTAATTMHLVKTQGTVGVADGEGKDIEPREALGLYSGYQVDTRSDSYAWIDLDQVKLTKMDQNSDIAIKKEDKHLEIEVKSGSLFFNVTQPLAEDETMKIRSSSMIVGIRGTCGWVEVPDEEHMNVYLLEGKVECSTGAETASVAAGEMAEMAAKPEKPIVVRQFYESEVKPFMREEAENALLDDLAKPSEEPADSDAEIADGQVIDSGNWEQLALTHENITICGTATVRVISTTSGNVTVYGNAVVGSISTNSGNVTVYGNAVVEPISTNSGNVTIYDNAVSGPVSTTSGNITISDSAVVGSTSTFSGVISDNR